MNDADLKIVAVVAARYASNEFRKFESWRFYDDEFAEVLLKEASFVCAAKYAATLVEKGFRHSTRMQNHRDTATGRSGPVYVVGRIMGEWLSGTTTVDQEMWQW